MKYRFPLTFAAMFGIIVVFLSVCPQARAQNYTVTPIAPRIWFGQNGHYSINASGQVAGNMNVSGLPRAFRWDPSTPNGTSGTLTNLGGFSGYDYTEGFGINSLGDVVGRANDDNTGVNWQPPSALFWPFGGAVVNLGGGGKAQQEAYAINASRDILLLYYSSRSPATNGINVSKMVNGKRKLFFLGSAWPSDINDAGQVLGFYAGNGQGNGVPLWTPNASGTSWTMQMIAPGGEGYDLNENGEAVGGVGIPQINGYHPFLYLPAAKYGLPQGLNDLWEVIAPVLPLPGDPNWTWRYGRAFGVNDTGGVVGEAVAIGPNSTGQWVTQEVFFWIWDSVNGPRSLGALVSSSGWTLTSVHRINNYGQIVATATNGTGEYCVLLTPSPE